MGIKTVDLKKAKINLNDLLEQVRDGTEIRLVENGKPIARLTPEEQQPSKRTAGLNEGALLYISEDFDAPLSEDFWIGEDK